MAIIDAKTVMVGDRVRYTLGDFTVRGEVTGRYGSVIYATLDNGTQAGFLVDASGFVRGLTVIDLDVCRN
jgi:hypothetical protein